MNIESRYNASTRALVIGVTGDFSFSLVDEFRAAYRHLDPLSVQIDLSQAQRIDSSALGMLLNMRKTLGKKTVIKITNSSPYVRRILSIANFDSKFDIR